MLRWALRNVLTYFGIELRRIPTTRPQSLVSPPFDRIHYACGENLLTGWLNVDQFKSRRGDYFQVNLIGRHPFKDNYFRFAFCEDFIEHLDQADSLIFLVEAHRTLRPSGVLRLSFPGLEGVLRQHYPRADFATYAAGRTDAYVKWGHRHFYSRESLVTVAETIGFRVEFVEIGRSAHSELRALDTRLDQAEINMHAELTKIP